MRELILLDADPEARLLIRSLLERDGIRVVEAHDPRHAQDVIRASDATAVLCSPALSSQHPTLPELLAPLKPNLDVLTPSSYGGALLDGAGEGAGLAEFARDALLLLGILAEEGARRPPAAEKLGRMTELTALRLGLATSQVGACTAAAALVALGPSLVAFRFGVEAGGGAQGGLSQDLQAALAALSALRCPYDLRSVIEAVEERHDGRGRPRGLRGDQIPVAARIVAVARDYSNAVAGGSDPMAAADLIRARQGTDYDPRVVEAFFAALRDETYVDRLTGSQAGARILVVDGEAAALAMTEMRLTAAGFQVVTCTDGAQAFEIICSDPPAVVVADTVLPRLDGISLLLKMRRHPEAKAVPLVFTSTRTDPAILNKAIKLGAKDVLAKPVQFDILVAKLRALSTTAQEASQAAGQAAVGNVAEMPLFDLFRVLALSRKTCKVAVTGPLGQGQVYFVQGTPVAAYAGEELGRSALASIVTWAEGTFEMTLGEPPPEHNMGG